MASQCAPSGFSDGEEIALGTDPLDPISKFEILLFEYDENAEEYTLNFSSVAGKLIFSNHLPLSILLAGVSLDELPQTKTLSAYNLIE